MIDNVIFVDIYFEIGQMISMPSNSFQCRMVNPIWMRLTRSAGSCDQERTGRDVFVELVYSLNVLRGNFDTLCNKTRFLF